MKKILLVLSIIVIGITQSKAQVAWVEPDPTDVTKPVRLYVDLDKLDPSKEHNVLLQADTGPFYIWTWKPFEHPATSPKVNGLGDKPWQNSNDLLQMTKDETKGAKVYYYEMTPTAFYEVAASKVYTDGISFLVKPKNGGGYGAPDIKSEDINLTINAPRLDKGSLYTFPSVYLQDEITTVIYDNAIEAKTTMQGLNDGDALMYVKATVEDTATAVRTTIEPAKFLKLQDNPKMTMKKDASGKFKIMMIPSKFLNIPSGKKLIDMEITVRKRAYAGGADQIDEKLKMKAGCQ